MTHNVQNVERKKDVVEDDIFLEKIKELVYNRCRKKLLYTNYEVIVCVKGYVGD